MANQILISKGVKNMFIALPFMFLGPAVMYNAFSNKQNGVLYYVVLAIGIGFCLAGMYFAFQGLNKIVKGLFNDKE